MRRYELSEGNSNKFWEIELEGSSFTTRFGRIGTGGQTSTKTFKSDDEARKQYEKIIAEKEKKGYSLVGEGDDEGSSGGAAAAPAAARGPDNPELADAILADPDAVDGYLVYGDWLQSQGDPLGELVAIQCKLAQGADAALEKKAAELIAANKERWLGGLDGVDDVELTWRYGFFHTATLGNTEEWGEQNGVELYNHLVSSPASRFLRELTLGIFDDEESGEPNWGPVLAAMAKSPLPTLRKLEISCFGYQISWTYLGDLSPLYANLDLLEELSIQMGHMDLGRIALRNLKSFEVVTGGLTKKNLKSIVEAQWPRLESLVLYFGDDEYGCDCKVKDLAPLFDASGIWGVKKLGLCNSKFADDIAKALPKSKILKQIKHLDLSKGAMGEAGAQAILANAAAFKHLETLDLSENYIPDELCDKLKDVCAGVNVEEQGDEEDPEDRYVQVAE